MEGIPKPKNNIEQKEEIKNLEGIDFVFSENPNIERMAIESVDGVDFSQLDKAEFVSLYRAEGKMVDRKNLPEASRGLAGTWFTTERDVAETYLRNEDYSLYQIDVPKQFYEGVKLSGVGNVIAKGECQLPLNLAEQKRLYLKDDEISKDAFKNFLIQYKKQHGEISLEKREEAKMVYGKYLETIFPESSLKDVVYHSTHSQPFEEFTQQEGRLNQFFFSKGLDTIWKILASPEGEPVQMACLLDVKKPKVEEFNSDDHAGQTYQMNFAETEGYDAVFIENNLYPSDSERAVFDSHKIHILGSQKDQEKFKEFIKKQG